MASDARFLASPRNVRKSAHCCSLGADDPFVRNKAKRSRAGADRADRFMLISDVLCCTIKSENDAEWVLCPCGATSGWRPDKAERGAVE